jgi:hypothetical protein
MSASLLPNQLASGTLTVRIAYGADVSIASSGWTFTDVSAEVLTDPPIRIAPGRTGTDSQSTSTKMSLTLKNLSGANTPRRPGARGLKKGTPIEVIVNSGTSGTVDRFTGFIDGTYQRYDTSGRYAVVDVTAIGILSFIERNTDPLQSVIRRTATGAAILPNVAAYWPGEDGTDATMVASALTGGSPMIRTGSGTISFASNSAFGGSLPLLTLDASCGLVGNVASSPSTTGAIYYRQLLTIPSGGLTDGTILAELWTHNGSQYKWQLRYASGGDLSLRGISTRNTVTSDSGIFGFGLNGKSAYISIELVQSGSDIAYLFFARILAADGTASATGLVTGTFTSKTVGLCSRVIIAPGFAMNGCSVGHIGVANNQNWLFSSSNLLTGYNGEGAWDRFLRLCAENGVTGAISTGATTGGRPMGTQTTAALGALLRECEAVDGGVMVDALGPARYGITLYPLVARHNATASVSTTLTAGQLAALEPQDDTQGMANKSTVSRTNGSSATFTQPAGSPFAPTGAASSPVIPDSTTLNVQSDLALYGRAAWRVHEGTVDEDRYPGLPVDLRRAPALADQWLAMPIGGRWTLPGSFSVAAAVRDQVVEGWTESISRQLWQVSVNVSPASPYDVAVACVATSFDKTIAAGWEAKWTTTGAGGTVSASDFAQSGGVGTMSVPAAGAYRRAYVVNWYPGDVDLWTHWKLAALPTGGPLEPANVSLRGSGSTYYLVRPRVNTSGLVDLQFFNRSGVQVGSTVSTGLTYTAGDTWRLHVQCVGSTFRARTWNTTGSEPSTWQATWSDTAYLAGGYAGLRSGVSTTYSGALPVIFTYDRVNIRPYRGRKVQSDSSTLHSGVSAGASSLSVDVGRLWTTDTLQFPFDLSVGGYQVTCTAISGSSSPQTFTVDSTTVTDPISSGATVKLWTPAFAALGDQ